MLGGAFDGQLWRLATTRGEVSARLVVNAAGLHGDTLDRRLLGASDFEVRPRKGQFVGYDKPAQAPARHILLPVPTATTKNVVVCRTIWGNLLVGPTAEEQQDRDAVALDPAPLRRLMAEGEHIRPALAGQEVTAACAGLRPATEEKGFRVRAHQGMAMMTIGGIRSTGPSPALGLGAHVPRLAGAPGLGWTAPADPVWPRAKNLSEHLPRDWQAPGHGDIACHRERVTEREVLAALDGPLGATTLAGVKRRTRATMGRCQGFRCAAGPPADGGAPRSGPGGARLWLSGSTWRWWARGRRGSAPRRFSPARVCASGSSTARPRRAASPATAPARPTGSASGAG